MSVYLSVITYRLSVFYASVYTSPSINRVSVCISISSVCYTSFGHFHCSVLRSVPPYVSFVILIAVIVILVIVIFVSFCLFVSFLFFFPFSTICLSVGFSISAPLRAHISHYIHSRFVPASNFSKIGTLRASGHLERTSGSRMRASEHRERTKQTKHPPKPTSGARSCTNVPHETLRANG